MADTEHHQESKVAALELLQKCSKQDAEKITHELLDSICTGTIPRYQNCGKIWTIEEWKMLQESGKETLKGYVGRGLSKEKISQELDQVSLPSEIKQVILDCLWPRQEEVRQTLVMSTACLSNSYLKDFDWKLKMTLASDKLATIREPKVALDFDVVEDGKQRLISVELSNDELKNLIASLESANKVVMQLKK